MALVGKASLECHFRERRLTCKLRCRPFEPEAARVLADGHPEPLPKGSGQMAGMHTGLGRQLGEGGSVGRAFPQQLDHRREPSRAAARLHGRFPLSHREYLEDETFSG
jgi:hypothetical protein